MGVGLGPGVELGSGFGFGLESAWSDWCVEPGRDHSTAHSISSSSMGSSRPSGAAEEDLVRVRVRVRVRVVVKP